MSLSSTQNDIIALFNLESEDIEDISYSNEGKISIIRILLRANYPPCPCCNGSEVVIKGYTPKQIKHSLLTDRKCILYYKARRYQCRICGRTYYEFNPFCFGAMKISTLTVENVLKDLKKQNETFTSVAQRYHISPTSVASIFDQHVSLSRLPLSEVICLDECYAFFHKEEKSKYVLTILDYNSQLPIDILPTRKTSYLTDYFLRIPMEERRKVKIVATDMNKDFRSLIHKVFPNDIIHAADRYHVAQDLSKRVDAVRKRIMKSIQKYVSGTKKKTPEYYLLKQFHWLIFKRYDALGKDGKPLFDPGRERLMNHKLERMLNYYDIRKMIEAIHPDLEAAWLLKDDVVDFYEDNTYATAPEAMNELIRKFFRSGVPEMIEFAKTIRNWKEEILNSFVVVNHSYKVDKETGMVIVSEKRPHTGILENKNSILKTIKKNSNGYTNWSRFRNRCLYILRPNALPSLNPLPQKRKIT